MEEYQELSDCLSCPLDKSRFDAGVPTCDFHG